MVHYVDERYTVGGKSKSPDDTGIRGWSVDAAFKSNRAAVGYATALVQDLVSVGGGQLLGDPSLTGTALVKGVRGQLACGMYPSIIGVGLPEGGAKVRLWGPVPPTGGKYHKENSPFFHTWGEDFWIFWESEQLQTLRGYSAAGMFMSQAAARRWAASCAQYWQQCRYAHCKYIVLGTLPFGPFTLLSFLSQHLWQVQVLENKSTMVGVGSFGVYRVSWEEVKGNEPLSILP